MTKLRQLAEVKNKISQLDDQNRTTDSVSKNSSHSEIVRDCCGYELVTKEKPSANNPIPGEVICTYLIWH